MKGGFIEGLGGESWREIQVEFELVLKLNYLN